MNLIFLLKGLVIGFSIAAPVGPIGILCIRRTLAEGRLAGLLSGLGAATADAMYGCIAGFGLTFIAGWLVSQQLWLGLGGGAFLCYLGVKIFLTHPTSAENITTKNNSLAGAYASTFFLTLTNPATILSFTAIFAGLGVASTARDYLSATILVMGVFLGSALWWLILSSGVSLFRTKFTPVRLRWVNRLAGVIIGGFGVVVLLSLLS
jgi:threonine/homoserine/homoserine lactone efflux protein